MGGPMPLRKIFQFIAIALLILTGASCATNGVQSGTTSQATGGGSWEEFPPLGEARQEIGVAELGSKIYVIGGITAAQVATNSVEVYDPATRAWSKVASLPARLHHIAAVSLNGKLYSIGGYTSGFGPVNGNFEYDPQSDAWTQKTSIPRALGSPAAAVIDGKIYLAGGVSPTGQRNSFFSYDPATDQWRELPAMPTPRDHLAATAIGGKFYAVGGRNPSDFTLDRLEVFDPSTNEWTRLESMPTGRSGIAAGVVRGCLYVFGGEGNARNINRFGVFPQNEMYNPKTNNWQTMAAMTLARHGIGAAVLDGKIHIPGGAPVEGFGVTGIHDAFVPPSGVNCE